MTRFAWLLSLAAVLSGCVSVQHVPLAPGTAESLRGREITVAAWERPDFMAMTASRAAIGGLIGALTMSEGGKNVVNNNNLQDPAAAILQAMAADLKGAHGWRFADRQLLVGADDPAQLAKDYPGTDVVLEVRTINWGYTYFPTTWNRYRVIYSGRLRLIDAKKGQVLAEGFCSRVPDETPNAPTGDELLANGAQVIKNELQAAASHCVQHFRTQTFALGGTATAVAAAAPAPAAPAPAFTPSSSIAATEKGAETVFWESSKDAADFRAYLQQYPNGQYAALARQRLGEPAAPAAPAAKSTHRWPSAGDTWTYRLTEPRRTDGPKMRNYTVKVAAASAASILEQYAIDGGPKGEWTHKGERQVLTLGKPVFSPYFLVFSDMTSGTLGRLQIADPACTATYVCEASGRVVTTERLRVPAGEFDTVKVEIRQNWRPMQISGQMSSSGGSTLTVWYAYATKRAVKVTSRASFGYQGPLDTDFDLELASYSLQ
jgi:hypothetical protein